MKQGHLYCSFYKNTNPWKSSLLHELRTPTLNKGNKPKIDVSEEGPGGAMAIPEGQLTRPQGESFFSHDSVPKL